jgi:lactoylglutathione lyase
MKGITSIGHVAINTADLSKSLDFYINTMGFPEMMRINHDNGDVWLVYLRVTDDQFIEIFPGAETEKTSASWHANGFGHLCLMVDDLQAVVDDLKGKGVTMMIEPKSGADGNSQAWLLDPDGNKIELMQMNPNSLQLQAIALLRSQGI